MSATSECIEGNIKLPVPRVNISTRTQRWLSWLFVICVCVEASFLVFQNVHVYRTKSAQDIDLTAFIILLVTNVFWMIYALTVLHGDLAVFVSGILYTIGSSSLIVAKVLYG